MIAKTMNIASFGLLFVALTANACKSANKEAAAPATDTAGETSQTAEPEGVKVSGSVPKEKTVDFVEAQDSVQISGVNLLGETHELKIKAVTVSGGKPVLTLLTSTNFTGDTFTQAGLPWGQYFIIEIDGKAVAPVQPVYQPTNGATNVAVFARTDNAMTIAAKMLEVAVNLSQSDPQRSALFTEGLFSVPALVVAAGSVYEAEKLRKANGDASGSGAAVNLSTAAGLFVTESAKEAAALSSQQRAEVARAVSRAAVSTLFDSSKIATPSLLAAQVTSMQIARDTETSGVEYNPSEEAMTEIGREFPATFVAYSTSQQVSAKYAADIASSGVLPEAGAAEYQSATSQEYEKYQADPAGYQNYVDSYSPPALPESFPPTTENPGSYTPPPPASSGGTSTGGSNSSPTPTPSLTPPPSPTPTPSESPSASPSGGPTPPPPIEP